ncbi:MULTISPECIES: hypothetical protein [Streptomyces]|uniref:hypothetical protein n=1 Tax=Streptomyces TaxID=1883 RepID=UPI0010214DEA|nr:MULTISPECIES: hypothetical protein [Streptomyces]MBV7652613.1 hypothetical protein [Streptomyces albidoflavus]MBV7714082.1 hypothetical protein [Streptomyces albidoflavus]MYX87814.1 hypothetical protein [Streptomyces sp. SID4915]
MALTLVFKVSVVDVSLAGAESRIDQIDSAPGSVAINLGMSRKAPAHPAQKEGAGSLRQSRDDQQ